MKRLQLKIWKVCWNILEFFWAWIAWFFSKIDPCSWLLNFTSTIKLARKINYFLRRDLHEIWGSIVIKMNYEGTTTVDSKFNCISSKFSLRNSTSTIFIHFACKMKIYFSSTKYFTGKMTKKYTISSQPWKNILKLTGLVFYMIQVSYFTFYVKHM